MYFMAQLNSILRQKRSAGQRFSVGNLRLNGFAVAEYVRGPFNHLAYALILVNTIVDRLRLSR
jgi:hypothetical protein